MSLTENALGLHSHESDFKQLFHLGEKKDGKDRLLLTEYTENKKNMFMESLPKLHSTED